MKKTILIITYGREKEVLETLKDIAKVKREKVELLILDNNETNKLEILMKNIVQSDNIIFKYYNDGKNYGVANGRNYIIEKATGEILITLDDDIEIEDIDFLLKKVEEYFNLDKKIGCLAFNIKNFYTRKNLRHEIPHGNKKLNFSKNLKTYYYIGAGHAIKKNVYQKVGKYMPNLGKYGGEESDLSYRILDSNYDILYCHDIIVYHKVSPDGRIPNSEMMYLRYRNKLKIINKYLPTKYLLSHIIVWSVYYLYKEKNIFNIIKVLKEIIKDEKTIIKKETEKKLKKLNARMYY